jgi:hypothetical protein
MPACVRQQGDALNVYLTLLAGMAVGRGGARQSAIVLSEYLG